MCIRDSVNTTNCYADMELEGNYVGGLVGYAENVMIENCMSKSYVNGSCVGGLVGCGDEVSQQYIISVSYTHLRYGDCTEYSGRENVLRCIEKNAAAYDQ